MDKLYSVLVEPYTGMPIIDEWKVLKETKNAYIITDDVVNQRIRKTQMCMDDGTEVYCTKEGAFRECRGTLLDEIKEHRAMITRLKEELTKYEDGVVHPDQAKRPRCLHAEADLCGTGDGI